MGYFITFSFGFSDINLWMVIPFVKKNKECVLKVCYKSAGDKWDGR